MSIIDKMNAWTKSCGHNNLEGGCRCKLMRILLVVLIINIALHIVSFYTKGPM
jgi:hypothetical protein